MDYFDFGVPKLSDLLGPTGLEAFRAAAKELSFRDGQTIHEEGEPSAAFCLVRSGTVQLVRHRDDGQITTVGSVGPGQHYGDIVALANTKRTHQAIALGDTVIWQMERDRFLDVIETDIALVGALYRIASYRLVLAIDLLDDMRRLPPTVRLAKLLLIFLAQSPTPNRVICRQDSLAQLLGTSQLTVANCLKSLARLNLLTTGYRHLDVPDIGRLQSWVLENSSR